MDKDIKIVLWLLIVPVLGGITAVMIVKMNFSVLSFIIAGLIGLITTIFISKKIIPLLK